MIRGVRYMRVQIAIVIRMLFFDNTPMHDPTERLAEALAGNPLHLDKVAGHVAAHLIAHGFGHYEDHVRAYEKYIEDTTGIAMTGDYDGKYWADRYLASLAEEDG